MRSLALVSACCGAFALDVLPEWARGGQLADMAPAWRTRAAGAPAKTFTAPLDWFGNATVGGVSSLDIRYWVDATKYTAGGPVFVTMGGEGAAGPRSCSETCEELGGAMLAVEHRFFGESLPDHAAPLSNDFLQFLSVAQNAADTHAITEKVKQEFGTTKAVAHGGSYSGATCAWFRQKYPGTVNGCVSQSGVVHTVWDYLGFDETVWNATGVPDAACPGNIEKATDALQAEFVKGNGASIKKMFNAGNLVGTKLGDSDFFYAVADGLAMLDQYGNKQALCDGVRVASDASPTERIEAVKATLFANYGAQFASQCFYDSECLRTRHAPVPGVGVGERSWRWMKCHSVGYLQAAPKAHPLRSSKYLTLSNLEEQCQYAFAMQQGEPAALNKKFTEEYYGKLASEASNVIFINYSDDPWRAASPLADISASLTACDVTCNGCGHCGSGAGHAADVCNGKAAALTKQWLA